MAARVRSRAGWWRRGWWRSGRVRRGGDTSWSRAERRRPPEELLASPHVHVHPPARRPGPRRRRGESARSGTRPAGGHRGARRRACRVSSAAMRWPAAATETSRSAAPVWPGRPARWPATPPARPGGSRSGRDGTPDPPAAHSVMATAVWPVTVTSDRTGHVIIRVSRGPRTRPLSVSCSSSRLSTPRTVHVTCLFRALSCDFSDRRAIL